MVNQGARVERQNALLDAVVALSGDLSLDNVLQRIVDSASELVDARYGFLGVLDGRSDRRLGTFAVHGLDAAHREMIGRLPQGLGLLGLVIDRPEPLRIANVQGHPDGAGFPRLHPDMTSFLGVPIRIHGKVFGNLYLTDKQGGEPFTAEDEAMAVALASAAGVAIENARLYEEGERQRGWLRATADIATVLLRPVSRETVHQLIVDRAREMAGADLVALLTPRESGLFMVEAGVGLPEGGSVGFEFTARYLHEVLRTQEPVVLTDFAGDPRSRDVAHLVPGLRTIQAHALHVEDGTAVLVVGWNGPEAPAWAFDTELPRGYTQQAALVMQVVRARETQAKLAVFEDRDRIGRDLHDLVIQRLFAIGLSLDSLSTTAAPELGARLSDAVDGLDQTIKEIRRTIFDLGSPLVPANLRLEIDGIVADAERLLGFRPVVDTRGPVESAVSGFVAEQLVAVLKEILSNVVRHSHAGEVVIELDVTDDITLTVTDDGLGLDPREPVGNGLRNMRHRAQNLGGSCEYSTPSHGGLTVRWSVPKENR